LLTLFENFKISKLSKGEEIHHIITKNYITSLICSSGKRVRIGTILTSDRNERTASTGRLSSKSVSRPLSYRPPIWLWQLVIGITRTAIL